MQENEVFIALTIKAEGQGVNIYRMDVFIEPNKSEVY